MNNNYEKKINNYSTLFFVFYTRSQIQTYAVETIAFYNVENLLIIMTIQKLETMIARQKGRDRWTEDILKRS
ncbi:MAG: hypothetical protein CM15mP59_0330 [Flavobacteriaceae bacterium]|nr:MAG: hypothetical protein CM15mP59_0330 [Flavobacteriaceae bacterium]